MNGLITEEFSNDINEDIEIETIIDDGYGEAIDVLMKQSNIIIDDVEVIKDEN